MIILTTALVALSFKVDFSPGEIIHYYYCVHVCYVVQSSTDEYTFVIISIYKKDNW